MHQSHLLDEDLPSQHDRLPHARLLRGQWHEEALRCRKAHPPFGCDASQQSRYPTQKSTRRRNGSPKNGNPKGVICRIDYAGFSPSERSSANRTRHTRCARNKSGSRTCYVGRTCGRAHALEKSITTSATGASYPIPHSFARRSCR